MKLLIFVKKKTPCSFSHYLSASHHWGGGVKETARGRESGGGAEEGSPGIRDWLGIVARQATRGSCEGSLTMEWRMIRTIRARWQNVTQGYPASFS